MDESTIVYHGIKITELISAIGVLLGIPAAIWGIFKLFLKDKKTEKKLNALEEIVKEQNKLNTNIEKQVSELKKHTDELHTQSLYKSDENFMREEALELEIQKYKDQTEKKYVELEEYYIEMLNALDDPLKEQIEALKKYIKVIKEERVTDYEMAVSTSLQLEKIERINHSDLYKIFITRRKGDKDKKIKAFINLDKALSLIKFFKDRRLTDFATFNAKFDDFQKYWRENIGEIQRLFESNLTYNQVHNIPPEEDPFLMKFDKIVINWHKKEDDPNVENIRDPYFLLKEYVFPLRDLCSDLPDPRSSILMPHIMRSIHAVRQIDHLKKSFALIAEEEYPSEQLQLAPLQYST